MKEVGPEQQPALIHFGWLSVGLWIGLTFLGYLLGIVFHFPGDSDLYFFAPNRVDLGAALLGFIFGAISGLITAALQWLALKPWLPSARMWLVFNAMGWGLVHAINDGVPIQFELQLVVTGLIVGLAQYLALRHLLFHATLWVPIATIAWFIGFELGDSLYAGDDPGNLIATGLTVGVITGLALRLLLTPVLRPVPNNLATNKPPLTRVSRVILWVVAVVIFLFMAVLLGGLNPFG